MEKHEAEVSCHATCVCSERVRMVRGHVAVKLLLVEEEAQQSQQRRAPIGNSSHRGGCGPSLQQ